MPEQNVLPYRGKQELISHIQSKCTCQEKLSYYFLHMDNDLYFRDVQDVYSKRGKMAVKSAYCALAFEEYMRVTWHCCAISKTVKISKQIDVETPTQRDQRRS